MIDALRGPLLVLAIALGTLCGDSAQAEPKDNGDPSPGAGVEIRHPVIPGLERFQADLTTDPVRGGLILLGELNCTSCHAADASLAAQILRKQAPILDKVGSRVRPSYLRAFLSDPHAVKPGTTMPHLLAALPAEEKAATVEALVHFLASTGSPVEKATESKLIPNGKKLYHQVGCVACHGQRDQPAPRLSASLPLGDLSSKYTIASLSAFLQDPLKVRPSGRMPNPGLVKNEASELASYLLEDLKVKLSPVLTYSYYEGSWTTLPDFDTLTPRASGKAAGFDLSLARRPNDMAMKFAGYFSNAAAGEYTFYLTSDDGSKLFIDGALVVDNNGIHPPATQSGKVELIKGTHRFVVGVFNAGSETELDVEYEGRGLARQSVLTAVTLTEGGPDAIAEVDDPGEDKGRFRVDHDLADKGRAHFARLGCASCHQLNVGKTPIASMLSAPSLSELSADRGGCVALSHATSGLLYRLGEPQRDALIATLKAIATGPLPPPTPKQVVAAAMTTFNCYACHQRDGRGGVEEARQEFFKTTQKEMGDEGRIPPSLDRVGAKIQADYYRQIFDAGARDRPYMLTRMPRFGSSNVATWIAAVNTLDPIVKVETPTFTESARRVKSIGRFLAGGEALGCIKCHNFKGIEAEGVQAVDMTVMTRRLRHDWFHRYLVDTQSYRPGTRMPTAWPNGKTMLPQVLDGDTHKQIEAIWEFLSDGRNAAEPYGLGRDPLPLVPEKEAIIYRNFLQGAGPRAIGVGYPERANLAFDANDLRIALIWQGSFIDASKHWSARGSGFQAPLGDNVLTLPDGPSLALLSNADDAWPRGHAKELGDAFRGYRLNGDGRPTFLYDIGTLHVADFPEPVSGANPKAAMLRRTLTIDGPKPSRDLWFRAIVAGKVEEAGDGWYTIDGEWKMRITADNAPVLRKTEGKTELLVPVRQTGDRETRIVQEFAW